MMVRHTHHPLLDPEQLRRAMRAWTTGVTVITAVHDGQQYGMTVNSLASVSLEPPIVCLTLKQLTHTHELIERSGEFAATILSDSQKELSDRFAGKVPDIHDRFEGVETETLLLNAPLIKGGLAYLNCRVMSAHPAGENTLFLAEVVAAKNENAGSPLVYHNRVYWKLDSPSP